ncbi:type 2 lantibiotic biosynthesis protein LanM [Inhella inkyongensis]|uniref:Type 2 lantibiotic biosynthesis protein LanM n=1 Tax=Inhella inkyongensis TaxID=392593 RepID=A0A840S2G1_9BURK|nr:type 2 lanthipeptide synthetase LanM [Inhella inkyongensis]MBB5202729.1 type 2 lantibiotic biosynthesis protein LanM [Inhella inkyongensis]
MHASTPSNDWLRALWARASTLDERLSGAFVPQAGAEDEAEQRWAAWLHLAAEDDPQRMARRLRFDGLQETEVRRLLGRVGPRPEQVLPPEFTLVAEALGPCEPAADTQLSTLRPQLPFAEVLAPWLLRAQQRLDAALAGQPVASVPALRLGCLRGLAARLCEFSGPSLAALLEAQRAAQPQGCYARVLQQAAQPDFWMEHAAMTRSMALAALHWVAASAELLLRWQADAPALEQRFGAAAAGQPVGLQTGLGDPHRGGREVARLDFASGLSLYYKPRPLSLDQAFAALLEQLRQEGAADDLQLPATLARADYGWVQGVVAQPVHEAAQVERYFERGGALLCLAHLLDITDIHSGNVIAVGEQPVLIDLETVCHQRARDLEEDYSDAELRARQTLAASVLGCGLLPDARQEGELWVELGGLSPGDGALTQARQSHWVDLGQDSMRREFQPLTVGDGAHQLMFQGRRVAVREQGAALQRGFERMARHAMARRQAWCAPGGVLSGFARCEARFIFRGTLVYTALLNRLNAPELCQEGVDRSLLMEALARPLLNREQAPSIWPLLAAERRAMAQGDVPHFHSPVDQAVLHLDGHAPISGYLMEAGMQRLVQRLQDFGEPDLRRELDFIASALLRPLDAAQPQADPASATPATPAELDAAALQRATQALGDELAARAIWGRDGSATWIQPRLVAEENRIGWQPLPPWLGEGVAGVALSLAYLEQGPEGQRFQALRRAAQRHLALGLTQLDEQPLGGISGAPSVAYALARIASLCGDRSALQLAGAVVQRIPLSALAADEVLDLAGGVAGTLLCLSSVREVAEAQGDVALAQACSLRIQACALRLEQAGAAGPIPTVAGKVLTGLSHGQSGFALALARLRPAETGPALQALGRAALEFERQAFEPGARNWRDLRPSASSPCACAWCHGAPGIGLVRAVLRAQGEPGVEQDLQHAARSTQAEPDAALDHLCCGNFGLVACGQDLAEALDDPHQQAQTRQRAARAIARAQAQGGYRTLAGSPSTLQSLGLFTGLAGIVYALLRLDRPDLPSVLRLQ